MLTCTPCRTHIIRIPYIREAQGSLARGATHDKRAHTSLSVPSVPRTMAPQVSGALWEFAPPALVPDLEVGRLRRQAALLAEAGEAEAAHVRSLAAAAEARCAQRDLSSSGTNPLGPCCARLPGRYRQRQPTLDKVLTCQARCAEGVALLGRSAADAAFDFALAGADGGVIDALASLQAEA